MKTAVIQTCNGYFDAEEDDEEDRENIDHPFPDPVVLSDSQAKKSSRFKLDFIWHLL